MLVKILFFAALRDALACNEETLTLPQAIATVGQLRFFLAQRGGNWQALAEGHNIRVACNQRMVEENEPLHEGDEVAFFPPVTGG